MADAVDTTRMSPLGESRVAARSGRAGANAGLKVVERTGLAMVGIAARKGQRGTVSERVHELFGVALPATPQRVTADGVAVLWTGPDQWLLLADGGDARKPLQALKDGLSGLASVTDQSDARLCLELSGPAVHEVLAKGVMLDLHPQVFGAGATAVTLIAHVGAQISRIDADTFELLVPRSYAHSFWHWLQAVGAAHGVAFTTRA